MDGVFRSFLWAEPFVLGLNLKVHRSVSSAQIKKGRRLRKLHAVYQRQVPKEVELFLGTIGPVFGVPGHVSQSQPLVQ